MAAAYLAGLNAEQRRAVAHGIAARGSNVAAPLLVIAGAGSGKTSTLAHRVAHLIVNGADPARILLLTFSRRAAAEMERRAQRIVAAALGEANPGAKSALPWSGTFHAIGARLLRMHATCAGLDAGFTIHDREDSADLLNLVRHELGLSGKDKRFPLKATCLAIYSRVVNAAEPLDAVLRRRFPWCAEWADDLRCLFESYVEAKQKQHVLDDDDLLLYWGELMKVPELAREVGDLFDHVLVDEYQDTNALQASILLGLKPDGRGLTVVGDDAQAIYGFRAASVRNILDFPRLFEPPATVVTLEQNYRSTRHILDASNAVIGLARERFTKNLRSDRACGGEPALVTVLDDAGQVDCVATTILENREAGIPLKQQAVLFRTASHSAMLEIELNRRNIPFVKFGGLKFVETAHVKDLLAVLRWAENPSDRVTGFRVLQLLDGIGPRTAGRVLDRMAGRTPRDALLTIHPPARAAEGWRALLALMQRWRAVFVLNVVDGCIPSDLATGTTAELEEERRLLYVAMTRAKDQLTLMVPQRFYTHQQSRSGDKHLYAARSRFIPAGIAGNFELRNWPVAVRGSGPSSSSAVTAVDLGARMRAMWSRTGTRRSIPRLARHRGSGQPERRATRCQPGRNPCYGTEIWFLPDREILSGGQTGVDRAALDAAS